MRHYGLLGQSLAHSYSQSYFEQKFQAEGIADAAYQLYERPNCEGLRQWVDEQQIHGLNVTIPYKEQVVAQLDRLTPQAQAVGAVNAICRLADGTLIGHNTDAPAFAQTLQPLLRPDIKKALVLGTGGAAKAVRCALKGLGIEVVMVSRNPQESQFADAIGYIEAVEQARNIFLIVNATPVGMYPHEEATPWHDVHTLSPNHICYDLIYNPDETLFLIQSQLAGAQTLNGLPMLHLQAELSWQFFQNPLSAEG